MSPLTHLDELGRAHMVDIGIKAATTRRATASARVRMQPATKAALLDGSLPKGDALAAARIAGIMAAKKTHELIPLCHPLRLDSVTIDIEPDDTGVRITAAVQCHDRTGVEMEALTAASVAALTLYDMAKSMDRGMTIDCVCLEHKSGGKSGTFDRD